MKRRFLISAKDFTTDYYDYWPITCIIYPYLTICMFTG